MKLMGTVDGIEIIFDFYPPTTFKAKIPKQLDGVYIIQLHAIDNAGNQTNYSTIYIEVDFKKMGIKILSSDYNSKPLYNDFSEKLIDKDISENILKNDYSTKLIVTDYSVRGLCV